MNEPTDDELRAKLIRNIADVVLEHQHRPPLYDTQCGSLTKGSAAVKLGAGYDVLAPGKRGCPYHLHRAQEEMFVILEGSGTLRVAGRMLPVHAGDVVMIPPGTDYPHHFINTSDAPMRYISISTKEYPEICEYPDSGKYFAYDRDFDGCQRIAANLDYWDGEP